MAPAARPEPMETGGPAADLLARLQSLQGAWLTAWQSLLGALARLLGANRVIVRALRIMSQRLREEGACLSGAALGH